MGVIECPMKCGKLIEIGHPRVFITLFIRYE